MTALTSAAQTNRDRIGRFTQAPGTDQGADGLISAPWSPERGWRSAVLMANRQGPPQQCVFDMQAPGKGDYAGNYRAATHTDADGDVILKVWSVKEWAAGHGSVLAGTVCYPRGQGAGFDRIGEDAAQIACVDAALKADLRGAA